MDNVTYDCETPDKCFSIRIEDENGNIWRRAVCPGDWEAVEGFAPGLVEEFRGIWTDEVVSAWREKQTETELDGDGL